MNIIPKLELNKVPKIVTNGSFVCAKNIVTDETGSFVTRECGFDVDFVCPNSGEFIVGVIPCNKELVIFTYNSKTSESKIYRKADDGDYIEINTSWQYYGGTIVGDYTYNYKGELIVSVCEYDATYNNGTKIKCPLKSWNLDVSYGSEVTYNIEENIPNIDCNYVIQNIGELVCGVYTFFLRFKLDNYNYTKWFQITDDILIIDPVVKEAPVHHYIAGGNITSVTTKNFDSFIINKDEQSNRAISLHLNIDKNQLFGEYQIGYIVKSKESTLGRIYHSYSIDVADVTINNNLFEEEISVDELLKNPIQLYNVKNIINYNNRIYLSNYEEYDNGDLKGKYNVSVEVKPSKVVDSFNYDKTTTYDFVFTINACKIKDTVVNKADSADDVEAITVTIKDVKVNTRSDGKLEVIDVTDFFNKFASQIPIKKSDGNKFINSTYYLNATNIVDTSVFGYYVYTFMSFYKPDDAESANVKLKDTVTIGNRIDYSKLGYSIIFDANSINFSGGFDKKDTITITGTGTILYYNIWLCGITYTSDYNEIGNGYLIGTIPINKFFISSNRNYRNPKWSYYGNRLIAKSVDFAVDEGKSQLINGYVTYKDTYTVTQNESVYNNNRTLIPYQKYNLFVHFIRKDKSYTNGYSIGILVIDSYNKTYTINDVTYDLDINSSEDYIYNIVPTISSIPTNYIGYFISYEEVEKNVVWVEALNIDGKNINVSNTEFEYRLGEIIGDKIKINNNLVSISKTKNIDNVRNPYISLTTDTSQTITVDKKYVLTTDYEQYNTKYKTLYRLTKDIYDIGKVDTDFNFMYHPHYYNNEKLILFENDSNEFQSLIISPTANNIYDENGNTIGNSYNVKYLDNNTYCFIPYNAISVKQDYAEGSVNLVDNSGTTKGVYFNKIVSPNNITDFLELDASYRAKPSKVFTNYNADNITLFNKTIRRSNVVSDESLINGFRNFEDNAYKNILENKGDIVNLVGIGLYLLIHTEHSIFVLDKTNMLTDKVQLETPDVFDLEYKELIPSNQGFGGLRDKEEAISTKNGYVWYDAVNKVIFNFNNGKIDILSKDICNFIKYLDIDTIRFGEDFDRNRLLICIYLNKTYDNVHEYTLTLSYNFNSNTFVSLHDYSFTNNYRTYNRSYFFNKYTDRKRLYCFNDSSTSYLNLVNTNNIYYDLYKSSQSGIAVSLTDKIVSIAGSIGKIDINSMILQNGKFSVL